MSKLQARTSATGKPSIRRIVVKVRVHSGSFSAGSTIDATCTSSQATIA